MSGKPVTLHLDLGLKISIIYLFYLWLFHDLNVNITVGECLLKWWKGGREDLRHWKGKTRTLNGHNRSTWYNGKLYYRVTTEIVQENTWATSHVTNSNTPTSERVKLPPNLNSLKLPPNQTPSYETWANICIWVIVIVLLSKHIAGLLLRWQWWWWCSGSDDPVLDIRKRPPSFGYL